MRVLMLCMLLVNTIALGEGSIILLNGVSCIGKSTTARQLHKIIPDSVIHSFDDTDYEILTELAEQYGVTKKTMSSKQKSKLVEKHAGELRAKPEGYFDILVDRHFDSVKSLVSQGKVVIMETVLGSYENDICKLNELRKSIQCLCVFVHCSLLTWVNYIAERHKANIDMNPGNVKRCLSQFFLVYKQADKQDAVVDTLTKHGTEKFLLKLKSLLVEQLVTISNEFSEKQIAYMKSQYAQQILQNYFQRFLAEFDLERYEAVGITAKYPFDLMINTAEYSAEQCAQIVADKFYAGL